MSGYDPRKLTQQERDEIMERAVRALALEIAADPEDTEKIEDFVQGMVADIRTASVRIREQ